METILSVLTGIGVAAACGFRVFVPLLALGLAGRAGVLPLNDTFAMLASVPALIALGTAALLEVSAYYVPWLDNALDVIAAPAAVVAGVLASAAAITDLPPVLSWGIAIIGGGGAAGLLHGATSLLRLKSTAVTGGAANPVVSTGELFAAVVTSVLALLVPIACFVLLVAIVAWAVRTRMRRRGATTA
ncbi:MAG TPA: DUF4126 domain-containing protein [Gemmatimonadaceae bacterium]|nr:DUF4126 domain-containing protein [Gemmatimonadaceae bacterium]